MAKAETKKILLADPDVKVVKQLNLALGEQGMEIVNVKDGPKALELAVSTMPDLMLMEIDLPYLNAIRVAQILTSNPKLKNVPILFMSSGKINPAYLSFFKNAVIEKPFNVDEVITRINGLLIKKAKSLEVQADNKEIVGNLSQMSIVDLLQIFSMNKKDGVLVVRREKEGIEGMVFLREGEIINATTGPAKGEKALYRILGWEEGTFEYIPKNFNPEVSIEKTTDSLLMEGMRQLDEWKRMGSEFPSPESLIYLKVSQDKLSSKLRPVTKEVIALLEFYKKVEDVVDNSSHPDFEVMMTINTLSSKGVLELRDEEIKRKSKATPLLTSNEAFAIKEGLRMAFRESHEHETVKIPVFTSSYSEIKSFANILANLRGFKLEHSLFINDAEKMPLGALGSVKASDDINLLFYAFPIETSYNPLWSPLMVGSIGSVILRSDKSKKESLIADHLQNKMKLRSVILDNKKGMKALGKEFFHMNLEDVKKEGIDKSLHIILSTLLDLEHEKEKTP